MKLSKQLSIALLISSCYLGAPAFSEPPEAKEYEKALMKYILSYEALQQAKKDPAKSAQLPKFVRKYRESYAQYLQLMRENDLYKPEDILIIVL